MPHPDSADASDSSHTSEAAASVEAAEAAGMKAASMEATEAKAVDEERCRPVTTGQLAFEHIDIEGQPVALEIRRLQHHNGITDCRPVGAEH